MSPYKAYLGAIRKHLAHGDATEHTHRQAMGVLLEALEPGLVAINEPKRIACGAPDFRIMRGKIPVGHIECKDIGTNLDEIEQGHGPHGEQFERYVAALPNWILTDYLEFRWYVNGEKRITARLADSRKKELKERPNGTDDVDELLKAFLGQLAPTITTAQELSERLAGMTRIIRGIIDRQMELEEEEGWLHNWFDAFKQVLLPDLSITDFSDMFAQTVAYGLFAARVHTADGKSFSRELAAFNLPRTNPFLRKLFAEIAGVDMPQTLDWAVDDVVELLRHTNMPAVLKDFGKMKSTEDPVVHFYETFLSSYDPDLRDLRGVYYTPEPVASFIARSVDLLLKEAPFKRTKGLADENTLILDPAVGTATFLYLVVDLIHKTFKNQRGAWDGYVADHLLNRVFGFELLMAPYAVAHLKLGMQLQQTGYTFSSDERLGIYLTNTLEEAVQKGEKMFGNWLSDEGFAAAEVKRNRPILVVLGNPPYSGISANRSRNEDGELTFIGNLIEDYKQLDGKPLNERKHWLQDDYVKFIRFAEWRIDRTGEGVLGYITNHGYLHNPTFRGMRQHLLNTFSKICVLDLHGNSKKREKAPAGITDANVFDIQQGVAIILCVKAANATGPAEVFHADLWGTREAKYDFLSKNTVATIQWERATPSTPLYMFRPYNVDLAAEYEQGIRIPDIMPFHGVGAVTARDALTVKWTKDEMWATVTDFASLPVEAARDKYELGKDARDWKVMTAQQDITHSGPKKAKLAPILYHPFDVRFTYYTGSARGFYASPCTKVMKEMFPEDSNIGLILSKSVEIGRGFEHVFCTRHVIQHHSASAKEVNDLFPLYLHQKDESSEAGLLDSEERHPNVSDDFKKLLLQRFGFEWVTSGRGNLTTTVGPEAVLGYIYAILHCPSFTDRYADELTRDFPRIQLTSDKNVFAQVVALGWELVELHLLESEKLNDLTTAFPERGNNVVGRVEYDESTGRVWINEKQFIETVAPDVWEFHVGGYQVCERWLKDRKGKKLTFGEIQHIQRVVLAIQETLRIMEEIDDALPDWPLT